MGIIPKPAIGHDIFQFHPTSILRTYFLSGNLFLSPYFFLGLPNRSSPKVAPPKYCREIIVLLIIISGLI
jgi:hypothetical protein